MKYNSLLQNLFIYLIAVYFSTFVRINQKRSNIQQIESHLL
jgi:hypothetical protein